MDRTSGSERDEEEEEEEREREKGGTCWSAFYTHLGEVERKSVWLRTEKDLWSHQPWWMDVTCSVWSFSAAFYIWYLILIAQQRAQEKHFAVMKATDGQKMWCTRTNRQEYWLESQQRQTCRRRERLSLLWIILFALVIFKSLWSAVPR